MVAAGADNAGADPRGHLHHHGNHGEGIGAVTELGVVAISPAVEHAVGSDGHTESTTRRDGAGGDPRGQGDFQRGARVPLVALPESAEIAVTPRVHVSVGPERQAEVFTSGDGDGRHPGRESHRDGGILGGLRSVAELAVPVVPPGVQGAVGAQCQAVVVAGSYCDGDDTGRQGNLYGRRGTRRGAIAELAIGAETPRVQRAVGSDCESVVSARRTTRGCYPPWEGDHCRDVGVSRGAVSQCPVGVVAKSVERFGARGSGGRCGQGVHGQWRRHDQHGQRRAHGARSPQAPHSPYRIVPGTTSPVRHVASLCAT